MPFNIPAIDDITQPALAGRLQNLLDNKTKPVGSLGQIERLAQRIGLVLGSETPTLTHPQLVVFAGDHGLAARGISAYPSDVTWQMVENFLAGGAAVSVLARQHGLGLTVVDCGVRHDFAPRAGLLIAKVAHGTADALEGQAMTPAQRDQALANGVGSFLAAWLYFALLERTDNYEDKPLHWLILIGGFVLLIASRFYLDIRVYGISL
mgnify:CR=1 FL=1